MEHDGTKEAQGEVRTQEEIDEAKAALEAVALEGEDRISPTEALTAIAIQAIAMPKDFDATVLRELFVFTGYSDVWARAQILAAEEREQEQAADEPLEDGGTVDEDDTADEG